MVTKTKYSAKNAQKKYLKTFEKSTIIQSMFKLIPTLTGNAALRFVRNAEKALKKRKSIDFSKQVETMIEILKRRKNTTTEKKESD